MDLTIQKQTDQLIQSTHDLKEQQEHFRIEIKQ